jgi:hypothetical protein
MTSNDRPSRTARQGDGHRRNRFTEAGCRAAHSLAAVISECHYAQRRLLQLRLSPDRYVIGGGDAPDTYAEFLFRTSGCLLHEPSADKRSAGRPTRH